MGKKAGEILHQLRAEKLAEGARGLQDEKHYLHSDHIPTG